MKLEPNEHWGDEDPQQVEMWPEDKERERFWVITLGVVLVSVIMGMSLVIYSWM